MTKARPFTDPRAKERKLGGLPKPHAVDAYYALPADSTDEYGGCEGCPECKNRSDFHLMESHEQLASYDAMFELATPDADCQYDWPRGSCGIVFAFDFREKKVAPRLTCAMVLSNGEVALYFNDSKLPTMIAASCRVPNDEELSQVGWEYWS